MIHHIWLLLALSACSRPPPIPEQCGTELPTPHTYKQTGEEAILFPLSYLFDRDGVIRFTYNEKEPPGEFSPPTLLSDLESLLAE